MLCRTGAAKSYVGPHPLSEGRSGYASVETAMARQIKAWFLDWLFIPLCWLVGLLAPVSVGLVVASAFPGAPWFVPWLCGLPFAVFVIVIAEWFRRLVLWLLGEAR